MSVAIGVSGDVDFVKVIGLDLVLPRQKIFVDKYSQMYIKVS